MTARRYDQCDNTCTADCGHCKGKGKPVGPPDPIRAHTPQKWYEPSDEDAAAKRIAAKYADSQTAQFAINDFRDWQEHHAIHERVTLAAAQAEFPMRTVEVRPTDSEDVACVTCRAAAGEPCRSLPDPRYTRNPHAARRAASAGVPFDPEMPEAVR